MVQSRDPDPHLRSFASDRASATVASSLSWCTSSDQPIAGYRQVTAGQVREGAAMTDGGTRQVRLPLDEVIAGHMIGRGNGQKPVGSGAPVDSCSFTFGLRCRCLPDLGCS